MQKHEKSFEDKWGQWILIGITLITAVVLLSGGWLVAFLAFAE